MRHIVLRSFVMFALLTSPVAAGEPAPAAPAAEAPKAPEPAARLALPVDPAVAATRAAENETRARLVESGLAYLKGAQNPDGSFGSAQVHLQTGLAILAFLSAGETPDKTGAHPVTRAATWLVDHSGDDGALGDGDYPMESHAICGLALAELIGMIPDPALASAAEERADQGLAYTLRTQDKAVGAEYFGGWKTDLKVKVNDRPVTAWQLLFLRSLQLRGRIVPKSALGNALQFLEGSQKIPGAGKEHDPADLGGFSYDAAGLPVVSVTGAGLAIMSLHGRADTRRDLALRWLEQNRPLWFGPQFYCTHFFASRGYAREARRNHGEEAEHYAIRLLEILRDHQNPDGSFQIPAGNAENTLKMGPTYATPMAILILDAERGLLPVDAL
jgi:hypothetical protein